MLWIILLTLVLIIVIALHIFFPKQYNSLSTEWKLSKIPGPRGVPFFGNAFTFLVPNEEFMPLLLRIVDQYKPICKNIFLGIPVVICTELSDIEVIINSRQHITKSVDYQLLLPWLGEGLLTSTGQKWFNHRKWLTPAFHFGILEQYIEIINKNAQILTEHLKAYVKDDYVEINPIITLCALDIICETAMGVQVDAQRGGEKEYVKATLRMSQLFQIRQLSPWLLRPWLFDRHPIGKEQAKVLSTLHGFTEKVIKERKEAYRRDKAANKAGKSEQMAEGQKKRMSFLDVLIEISETQNKLTEVEIREEVDTFMFEGHDTTSAGLCWALHVLGTYPDIQEKAYQELNEIFQGSDRLPTSADLQEMKYLERVIKETLRLYPSVPVISRLLETDVKLCNYVVPAGTNTPIFIYYIHRDPRLYPDPEKFDPDRFLPEAVQGRHPYAYIPFSAGPRNCIGQRFALMEEKIILSQILRNFQVTALDKKDEIQIMAELILRPKNNLRIMFRPR